jgi:hypothetical protein
MILCGKAFRSPALPLSNSRGILAPMNAGKRLRSYFLSALIGVYRRQFLIFALPPSAIRHPPFAIRHPPSAIRHSPSTMPSTLWTVLGVAAIGVVGYLLVMGYFWHQSREIDKQIDFSKIKPLKDEDD